MRVVLLAVLLALGTPSPHPLRPRGAPEDTTLIIGTSVEGLLEAPRLSLPGGSALNLEPGIRLTQAGGTYTFATHDGDKVEINTGSEKLVLPSPVTALLTDRGWEFNGSKPVKAVSVTARRRQAQDDADTNLKSMQEAAKKLVGKAPQPARKLRVRWVYAENAFATAELFNSGAIQQLSHISPAGF